MDLASIALVVSDTNGTGDLRISMRAVVSETRRGSRTPVVRASVDTGGDDQQIDRGVATQPGANITGDGLVAGSCSPTFLPIPVLP